MRIRLALLITGSLLLAGVCDVGGQELVESLVPNCQEQQFSPKFSDNRPWFNAWPSGSHEPQTFLLTGWSKRLPYTAKPGVHRILEGSIGMDVPIGVFDRGDNGDVPIGKGCWGVGLWLPLAFPMILDLTENGQPVVNTDYNIGIAGKIAYGVSDHTRLGFLAEFGHESTHLAGDFTKNAENIDEKYQLIDVNYEFWKFGINVESERSWGVVSLRFTTLFASGRGHQGFYSYGYQTQDGSILLPSKFNYEPAVGLQYMPPVTQGWHPYLSADVHFSPTYNYDKQVEVGEKVRVSQTYLLGFRKFGMKRRGVPDLVMRLYRGRNPHGQLRNQNTWWAIQLGALIQQ